MEGGAVRVRLSGGHTGDFLQARIEQLEQEADEAAAAGDELLLRLRRAELAAYRAAAKESAVDGPTYSQKNISRLSGFWQKSEGQGAEPRSAPPPRTVLRYSVIEPRRESVAEAVDSGRQNSGILPSSGLETDPKRASIPSTEPDKGGMRSTAVNPMTHAAKRSSTPSQQSPPAPQIYILPVMMPQARRQPRRPDARTLQRLRRSVEQVSRLLDVLEGESPPRSRRPPLNTPSAVYGDDQEWDLGAAKELLRDLAIDPSALLEGWPRNSRPPSAFSKAWRYQ